MSEYVRKKRQTALFFRFVKAQPDVEKVTDLISQNKSGQSNLLPSGGVKPLGGCRERNSFLKKSIAGLTGHKDGERVVH